jgi:hypothetical protein
MSLAPTETAEHRMVWKGPVADFLLDETEQICLEGAIRSGKTTVAIRKVIRACLQQPGIHWLICRFSDGDTASKLRPVFERMCVEMGVPVTWHADGRYYEFPNGSWVYAFGIKAQSLAERYAKFRGVTLACIYNDQTEELPEDIYEELCGRLSQPNPEGGRYVRQIVLTPNPMEEDSWLAQRFPVDNTIRHRRYYRVSLYDNAHNLDQDTIDRLERTYPIGHAKHKPMLLGMRGMNVIGKPVYGPLTPHQPETAAFQRGRHERPLALDPNLPLLESIDYGKHHPCVVWAQYSPWGDLHVLGGILGQHLYLEDFAPIVQQYRQRWFPNALEVQTCCDPAGSHNNSQGLKQNGVSVLTDKGFTVTWKQDSNAPSVRLAMIERLAGHMRRRSPRGEAFGVDDTRWLRLSVDMPQPTKHRFIADACEAGYVWDQHLVSVGNKPMRKPKKDGWYEHGMNCLEYLEHNFGGVQPTIEETIRHASRVRAKSVYDPPEEPTYYDQLRRANPPRRESFGRRGGY